MNTQKKLMIAFVCLLVIFGIVTYVNFWRNSSEAERADQSQNESATTSASASKTSASKTTSNSYLAQDGVYVIKYTNAGFVPNDIQIPRGKSIRFINMTDTGMRIISDNTDPKFAGLTEAKTIGKGATYTFTFSEVGLWVYHNQSTPNQRATVLINQF
ncbi:MAG: hypothetical protein V4473_02465 [Patescibacteria group bacterium]